MSLNLARSIVQCPYAQIKPWGPEDVQTGVWIKSCVNHSRIAVKVYNMYNGYFFCHTKEITDMHISNSCFSRPICQR